MHMMFGYPTKVVEHGRRMIYVFLMIFASFNAYCAMNNVCNIYIYVIVVLCFNFIKLLEIFPSFYYTYVFQLWDV